MQICCDGDLYPKNRFQCCAGAVKPREEGGIRCCNHVGGSGPSSGPKYPMTEYQPLDGEKCCIGLNSFGKKLLSGNISSTFSGLYASSREKCCGGKVISERKGCCGTGPKAVEYDPRFMGCCKTRTWAQSYDPSGEICCGNRVIKKDGKVSILKRIF